VVLMVSPFFMVSPFIITCHVSRSSGPAALSLGPGVVAHLSIKQPSKG
jgi:hypothetical protein